MKWFSDPSTRALPILLGQSSSIFGAIYKGGWGCRVWGNCICGHWPCYCYPSYNCWSIRGCSSGDARPYYSKNSASSSAGDTRAIKESTNIKATFDSWKGKGKVVAPPPKKKSISNTKRKGIVIDTHIEHATLKLEEEGSELGDDDNNPLSEGKELPKLWKRQWTPLKRSAARKESYILYDFLGNITIPRALFI